MTEIVIDKPGYTAADKARVVLILDETESMMADKNTTLEKVNTYLASLTKLDAPTLLSIYTFNSPSGVVCRLKNIGAHNHVRFTDKGYAPSGMTPLYDAIGQVLVETPLDMRTQVVIMTDGMENSSTRYARETVRGLIESREERGWNFIFLGAGLDAATVGNMATGLGISGSSAMSFGKGEAAQGAMYGMLAEKTAEFRGAVSGGQGYSTVFTQKDREKVGGEGAAAVGGNGQSPA